MKCKPEAQRKQRNVTPTQAIRQKCLECSCGSRAEASECILTACPLHPFRPGQRPTTNDL